MAWAMASLGTTRLGTAHPERRLLRDSGRAIATVGVLAFAFVAVPFLGDDYWFTAILIPVLVLSLAGLGLNLLTGYAGQLSVGSAAFMGIGAYLAYDIQVRFPEMPLVLSFVAGATVAAAAGVLAGIPSFRITGFYLVVCTLTVQFFVEWALSNFRWFSNGSASGLVSAPPLVIAGRDFGSPAGRYLLTLSVVTVMTLLAHRIVRGEVGRRWMAVRDMDTAAAIIGIPVLRTKLLAFAVSSFYCGMAGALWGFAYLGTFDPRAWELDRSFQILFIIIIGGMGSLSGSFFGAAFILVVPLAMSQVAAAYLRGTVDQGTIENYKKIVFGVLIVFFLVKEPRGLARLHQTFIQRIRSWPLRHW